MEKHTLRYFKKQFRKGKGLAAHIADCVFLWLFVFLLVCSPENKLEGNDHKDHYNGEEPEAGPVVPCDLSEQLTDGGAQAKPQRIHRHKDAQDLGVGGRAKEVIGHKGNDDCFQGQRNAGKYGGSHRHYHTQRSIGKQAL